MKNIEERNVLITEVKVNKKLDKKNFFNKRTKTNVVSKSKVNRTKVITKKLKPISKVIKKKVKKGVYTTANKKLHQTINNNTIISPTNNPKIHPKKNTTATKNNLTGGSSKNIDDDDLCKYIDNVDKIMLKATKQILNISEVMKKQKLMN